MRMYERFTGCRVLSYCVMTNHFHLLLEVPPLPDEGEFGITEEDLIYRLGGLYSRDHVVGVEAEIEEARILADGEQEDFERLGKEGQEKSRAFGRKKLAAIFERYTRRMHDLSEFMRGLLQRYTRWFNKQHGLRGHLWEDRFHSVIVESGLAARTMAAYLDLNPVRADMVEDPADYRWSSYGEAVGGGRGAKKAQEGLVRAMYSFGSKEVSHRSWAQGGVGKAYRKILISAGMEQGEERGNAETKRRVVVRKGMDRAKGDTELARLAEEGASDLKISKVIQCRVRYFTDGAVIGSKSFVNGVFQAKREQFGPKRKDGARKPRGALGEMAGDLWSLRDLKDLKESVP
jgi:REP element-mobilizing transposase RayT